MNRFLIPFFLIFSILTGCGTNRSVITRPVETVKIIRNNDTLQSIVQVERANQSERAEKPLPRIHAKAYDLYVTGLLYDYSGEVAGANQSFKQALQFSPLSYDVRYALAESYYKLRQFQEALGVLEIIEPVDEDVYLLRAAAYYAVGHDDSAKHCYRSILNLDKNSTIAYSYLAGFYRQEGEIDSLIWCYQNLVRVQPDQERHWLELGRLQAQKGDFQDAKSSFKTSMQLNNGPDNILAYVGLAEVYNLLDRGDSAMVVYKQALQVDPNNSLVNREISMLYIRMDSLAAAVPYAARVVDFSPQDRNAVRRLGVLYYGLDSLSTADSIFTWLVNSGERNPLNHYYLGRIALLQKEYKIAVEEFSLLTQMADTVAESWLDLGYAYRQLADFDKEILVYKTGLNHVTQEVNAIRLLFALGAAYEQSGQIDKAVATFEEIIARSPDYAQALNYLGYMLADRGERLEYALELIEKAVQLSPENAAFLDSYGWVYYQLGDFDKALTQLQKAVSIESDPTIFDHLGDIYKALGDIKNASLWWQKALDLNPDNAKIKEKLANSD